ncbi:hypothetical protein [Hyperthermus butylicus]|uniref:Crenarchaeal protein n=1 Tax=Hyperthermus butylicus (strain DSM 5456 / JCM 9403 / PLM1-5) TaxID=415426 RepID=A2BJ41_HYPBU|nr:hypothetical protein [Hyperthermus butylicus]ABM80002.1 putative crenarchaeal protein [Hyperthermus butylicus DSM 5456]
MHLRLRAARYFTIPYSVFDILLQMRGAIDPDSGQIVCHFYSLGVAALETSAGAVPVIVVDGCLMASFGKENVEAILSSGSAVEVENFTLRGGKILIGDVEIDSTWGLAAIAYAGETGAPIKLYKLRLEIDGEEAPIAGIYVEASDAGPLLLLIPSTCEYIEVEEPQPPTHM